MTMQYINTETKQYPISESEIRNAFPRISFPAAFVPPAPYMEVKYSPYPEFDSATHTVTEAQPVELNGAWYQGWSVVSRPPEPVPQQVTKRQLKQAMTRMGLRDAVEALVASADQDTKDWWIESDCFERHHPVMLQMAEVLGKTASDLDALFILASSL